MNIENMHKKIRVNGNYFERFLFSTFPFVLVAAIIFYLFKKPDVIIILPSLLIMSIVFFILDKIPLRKTRLAKVIIENNMLLIDGKTIAMDDITVLRPYKTSPPQSLLIFELYLKDGSCLKFMDKPKPLFYKANNQLNSKSLDLLFSIQPKLKSKLRSQHYL